MERRRTRMAGGRRIWASHLTMKTAWRRHWHNGLPDA